MFKHIESRGAKKTVIKSNYFTCFIFLIFFFLASTLAAHEGNEYLPRKAMGWLESITLMPWDISVRARLDSGAKTSSIHASEIQWFSQEGVDWVRFEFIYDGNRLTIERPLVREVMIKRKEMHSHKRPVISLAFCLGGERYESGFSLVDRGNFNYPVILGRNFLKDIALIDPANSFLVKKVKCV